MTREQTERLDSHAPISRAGSSDSPPDFKHRKVLPLPSSTSLEPSSERLHLSDSITPYNHSKGKVGLGPHRTAWSFPWKIISFSSEPSHSGETKAVRSGLPFSCWCCILCNTFKVRFSPSETHSHILRRFTVYVMLLPNALFTLSRRHPRTSASSHQSPEGLVRGDFSSFVLLCSSSQERCKEPGWSDMIVLEFGSI